MAPVVEGWSTVLGALRGLGWEADLQGEALYTVKEHHHVGKKNMGVGSARGVTFSPVHNIFSSVESCAQLPVCAVIHVTLPTPSVSGQKWQPVFCELVIMASQVQESYYFIEPECLVDVETENCQPSRQVNVSALTFDCAVNIINYIHIQMCCRLIPCNYMHWFLCWSKTDFCK